MSYGPLKVPAMPALWLTGHGGVRGPTLAVPTTDHVISQDPPPTALRSVAVIELLVAAELPGGGGEWPTATAGVPGPHSNT